MATAEKISAKLSRGEETRHTVRKVLADFAACAADDAIAKHYITESLVK